MFSFLSAFRPAETVAKPVRSRKTVGRRGVSISDPTYKKFTTILEKALETSTKKEIAEKIGVTPDMVYKYLNGSKPARSIYLQFRRLAIETDEPEPMKSPTSKKAFTAYSTSDLNVGSYLYYRGAKVDEITKLNDFPRRVLFKFKHDNLQDWMHEYLGEQDVLASPSGIFRARAALKSMAYNLA